MDRRTLIALVLGMLALQAYFYFVMPHPVPEETVAVETAPPEEVAAPPVDTPPMATKASPVSVTPAVDVPVRKVPFEFCTVKGKLTSEGGYLENVNLADRQSDYEAEAIWAYAWRWLNGDRHAWRAYRLDPGPAMVLGPNARALGVGAGLEVDSPRMEIVEENAFFVTMRGVTANGLEITRKIERAQEGKEKRERGEEECVLGVDVTWRNVTTDAYNGPIWVSMFDEMPEAGGRYTNVRRPIGMVDGGVIRWPDLTDLQGPALEEGQNVGWFGIADHYFGAYVLPGPGMQGKLEFAPWKSAERVFHGERFLMDASLLPGATRSERFKVYIGPNELEVLRGVRDDLAKAVDLGWFGFFGRILLWLLKFFQSIVGNWGVAIICLTFLVKLVFFPLTQMSFKSSQAMQALQPKLQELREKLADNQEELNRQTIALFKEHGVNPVGGCLPMLIQMPIWIALYNVLLSSVELYQTEFLYLKDLASVDPYAVMPIAVTALMMIQQQMTPMGNLDPAQQKIMKYMPLMFALFFFASPSGLTVYIFVNMVLTILQQWLIKRTYATATAAA